jgi:hypothetical protein
MITDLQQKDTSLDDSRYENIFNLARADKYYFYNIIKKISFPDELNTNMFYTVKITSEMPWTTFAHQVYGDQTLWWLICILNNIQNPTTNPAPGILYKVIEPSFVSQILAEINRQG